MPHLLSSLSLGGTKGSLTPVTNAGEEAERAHRKSVCVRGGWRGGAEGAGGWRQILLGVTSAAPST